MDVNKIIKIIEGKCSKEEMDNFYNEISSDDSLIKEYAKIKNEYIFNNLPYTTDCILENGKQFRHRKNAFDIFLRVVAVLFLPILVYFLINISSDNNVFNKISGLNQSNGNITDTLPFINYYVNNGVKGDLYLPDGTHVWLNSGSSISFPPTFGNNNRYIRFSGEGYFSVNSDKSRPFYIQTNDGINVKVTGTEFNISCYEDDLKFIATLVSGSMEVYSSSKANESINMLPEEELCLYKCGKVKPIIKHNADVSYATAWKRGILMFHDMPMYEVIKKVERWFGYDIIIKSSNINKYRFTGEFDSESLINVLETIRISSNIKYSINNKKVIIVGD